MAIRFVLSFAAGIAFALCPIHPSVAADSDDHCTIGRIASFDLGAASDGSPTIPVTIAGHPYIFRVDPAISASWVSSRLVATLDLTTHRMPSGMSVKINDEESIYQAIVHDMSIGSLHGDRFTFMEAAPGADDADGEIGLDMLAQFDVDLDLKAGTLRLYSQDHCPGRVVYWAGKYGAVAFQTDAIGHPFFKAHLDGNELTVSFAAGAKAGVMGMLDAGDRLGIKPTDTKLVPDPQPAGSDGPNYTYPFTQLAIGDLTINHPDIVLVPQKERCSPHGVEKQCYGSAELLLGRAEMRQLHLYFAFKEKMLYLTCADPSMTLSCNAGTTSPTAMVPTAKN